MNFKSIFNKIWIQLTLLSIISVFLTLSSLGIFKSPDEVISILKQFIITKGFIFVAGVSFWENFFGFNTSLPGAVIIFTAMSLTYGNLGKALLVFSYIYVPVLIANTINFLIGRKIFRPSKNEASINIWRKLLLTCWHPYLASISSVQLGNAGVNFKSFIFPFIIVSFFWNTFWGVLAYNYGSIISDNGNYFLIAFISYILLWTILDLINLYKSNKFK